MGTLAWFLLGTPPPHDKIHLDTVLPAFRAGKVRRDSGGGIGGWAYPSLFKHIKKTIQTVI
jgi:hypothetical protein